MFSKFISSMVTLIVAEDEENCLESDKYKRMIVRKNINLYEQKIFIVLYLIINKINETDKKFLKDKNVQSFSAVYTLHKDF